jgi:hypothetical protein
MLEVVDTASGPAVLVTGLALRLINVRTGCQKAVDAAADTFAGDDAQIALAEALSVGADHVAVLLASELREALITLMNAPQTAPAEPKVGQYL